MGHITYKPDLVDIGPPVVIARGLFSPGTVLRWGTRDKVPFFGELFLPRREHGLKKDVCICWVSSAIGASLTGVLVSCFPLRRTSHGCALENIG